MQPETTVWNRCVRDLQAELPEQQFNTWRRPLQPVEDGPVLKLLAPNRFVVDWLNQHYLNRIEALLGGAGEVVVEVGSRQGGMQPAITAARPAPAEAAPPIVSRLNPDFVFDNFVEGKSNQLARAAAYQVGENPGKSYNPLFIYGGVGLGKTHLMQAIGNVYKLKEDKETKLRWDDPDLYLGSKIKKYRDPEDESGAYCWSTSGDDYVKSVVDDIQAKLKRQGRELNLRGRLTWPADN